VKVKGLFDSALWLDSHVALGKSDFPKDLDHLSFTGEDKSNLAHFLALFLCSLSRGSSKSIPVADSAITSRLAKKKKWRDLLYVDTLPLI